MGLEGNLLTPTVSTTLKTTVVAQLLTRVCENYIRQQHCSKGRRGCPREQRIQAMLGRGNDVRGKRCRRKRWCDIFCGRFHRHIARPDDFRQKQGSSRRGGGIASTAEDSFTRSIGLYFNGSVRFMNNTCGGSGGAMALSGELGFALRDSAPLFLGNSAGVFGGAVFISGATYGHTFDGVLFAENQAQVLL